MSSNRNHVNMQPSATVDDVTRARDARDHQIADRLTRSAADDEIVRKVREAGPGSIEYRYLADALRDLGVGTLFSLYGHGRLFAKLGSMGLKAPPPPSSFRENVPTLIHISVNCALDRFMHRQIIGDGWRSDRGASVRTFFVNTCVYQFSDEYRKFCAEEDTGLSASDLLLELERAGPRPDCRWVAPDPEDVAIKGAEIAYLTRLMSERQRMVILLVAEGCTHKEVGEEIGMTADAVSMLLRRARSSVRALDVDDAP